MSHLAYQALSFFEQKITGFYRSWTYSNGINVPGESPPFYFFGVIQPVTAAILQSLPEGQRANVQYTLDTQKELLFSVQPFSTSDSTYITYRGKNYKIIGLAENNQWGLFSYVMANSEVEGGK
jgi:hypothetical protein